MGNKRPRTLVRTESAQKYGANGKWSEECESVVFRAGQSWGRSLNVPALTRFEEEFDKMANTTTKVSFLGE